MKYATVIPLLLAAALAGCNNEPPISWPRHEMTLPQRNFEAQWIASQQVLRQYGFKIARTDRRACLVTTEPMLGQHAVEFWRKDAATARDVAEGTLQAVYRTAEVQLRPARIRDDFEPIVTVRVVRSEKPNHQFRTINDAYRLHENPEKWAASRPAPLKPDQIEQLPNDKRLADDIALEIRARAYRLLQDNPPRKYPR